jgi:DNA-binding transcriptional LysR family regulator
MVLQGIVEQVCKFGGAGKTPPQAFPVALGLATEAVNHLTCAPATRAHKLSEPEPSMTAAAQENPSSAAGGVTLRAMEVFVAVVEAGSMSAAAGRLKASPSGVSQQVANLEQALGVKLLDRQARPIALTPAGFLFERRALAVLDEVKLARGELMELRLSSLPRLRLAMIDELDVILTPELIGALARRYPQCAFEAWSGGSLDHIAALEERRADVVVAADNGEDQDWLERHRLLREPFVLVSAKGLLDPAGDVLAQLLAAPLVRYSERLHMGRQIERHLRRIRLRPPRRYAFNSSHSVLAMVCDSGGWALTTPLSYLDGGQFHARIEIAPLPFAGFFRTVSLLARRGELGEVPAALAELCRELVEKRCVAEARKAIPWLGEAMRVTRPDIAPVTSGPSPRRADES